MKINIILLLGILTGVLGKNVFNLEKVVEDDIDKRKETSEKMDQQLEKRKNVFDFNKIEAIHKDSEKRDAKNTFDFDKFRSSDDIKKRDAKNTFNLDKLKALHGDYDGHLKRDAKFVVDLNKIESLQGGKGKRDAKYVVDLNLFKGVEENKKRSDFSFLDLTALSILFDQNSGNEEINQVYFKIKDDDSINNLLQSVLPSVSEVSIFASYIRDDTNIFEKTGSENEIMVLFAPTNDAISHKLNGCRPWEFPNKIVDDEIENEIIIQKNIEHFLNGHIISNFEEKISLHKDSTIQSKLINGNDIKIKQTVDDDLFQISLDGKTWIKAKYVKQVKNGFIFVIDDVLVNC